MAVHRRNVRYGCSVKAEGTFAAGLTPATDFTKLYRLSDTEETYDYKIEDGMGCGGEHPVDSEQTEVDNELAINTHATPEIVGYLASYALGAYSVSGAGDPYTHTCKETKPPIAQEPSLAIVRYYEGDSSTYHQLKGGVVDSLRVASSVDGERRVSVSGRILFNGARATAGTFVPPTCAAEKPYRHSGLTVQLYNFGGAEITGLRVRTFEWSIEKASETDPTRTGLFAATREHGDRVYKVSLVIEGTPDDALDDVLHAHGFLKVVGTYVHSTGSNRDLVVTALKCRVDDFDPDFPGSVGRRAHKIELRALLDTTSGTTEANSPLMVTIENAVPTYRA